MYKQAAQSLTDITQSCWQVCGETLADVVKTQVTPCVCSEWATICESRDETEIRAKAIGAGGKKALAQVILDLKKVV
eukprot:7532154-Alexandrium_andersonii.AAC.1